MRRLNLFMAAFLVFATSAMASEWDVIKHNGRDHVPMENVARFYGFGNVTKASNRFSMTVAGRSLRGSRNSAEIYINNIKFILSYPVSEVNGKLLISRMDLTKVIEPVLRPQRIRDAQPVDTIILDAGHGGHDRGAQCSYGDEKFFTLDVAQRAQRILSQHGFKVEMTRTRDVFVSLDERVKFANRFQNAVFVSIHFNSGRREASGIETFTLAPRGVPSMAADGPRVTDFHLCKGNARDPENMALATAMHASLAKQSQLYDRGIKRARFVVIRDILLPGVLLEGGFLSNPGDSRKIATPAYRQRMAFAVAHALQNYKRSVSPDPKQGLVARQTSEMRPTVTIRTTEPSASSHPDGPAVVTPRTN